MMRYARSLLRWRFSSWEDDVNLVILTLNVLVCFRARSLKPEVEDKPSSSQTSRR